MSQQRDGGENGKTPTLSPTISGAKRKTSGRPVEKIAQPGPRPKRKVKHVATPTPGQADAAPPVSKVPATGPRPRVALSKGKKPLAFQSVPTNSDRPVDGGNGPQIKPVATPPPAQPTHPVPARDDRLKARADLASVYASLLGRKAVQHDLIEVMQSALSKGCKDASFPLLREALSSLGLEAEIEPGQALEPDRWPALALMTNGQAVMVLSQEGDQLRVYEAGANGASIEVDRMEFSAVFTGTILRAEIPLSDLAARHAPRRLQDHWFWGELPKFRRHFADVALGSFVANMLAVAVALFSLQVYDRVIPHQSTATLWVLAAGAFVAILLEAAIKAARARLMDGAGRRIELNVQRLLMDRILGMRSDRRPTSPSSLFATMREFGSVREFFTASSVGTLTDLPFIVLFLVLVASIAGNVVWVLIAGGILMVLPGFFLQKRMIAISQETQGASTKASRLLHEAIYELDTLKTQRGEDRVRRLWTELNMLSAVKNSEQRKLTAWLTFWSQGVQQATYVSAVILGTYMVFAGEFTVGSIIAVGILSGRTLAPLTQLSGTLARWSNVKSALDGLDMIAGSEQDEAEGRTYLRRETLRGGYEIREMRFAYDEDTAGIDVPGLAVEPGQKIAVLGANGSGKSTFLKVLAGLYTPTTGRVMVDGVDMSQIAPRDLRRSIGYLGQDVRLFAGTLRDNLNLSMLEREDDRLLQALDFAGLGPFVRGHAKGLDLEIRDMGEGLSIGQRQSIGWARVWLQDPQIVLLDEPTAALDQMLERTLISRLETWLDGRTALIATHRMPIMALTERTLIFQNGRLTVDGPRDQVLAHLKSAGQGAE
ncbi:ATP-binding cassette domain-containing protein [Aliiroseovarius crassostreae]|uniref:ATP-binding cassette domain-containing protein n=1 Tax=Aliiroseovarius crassostreae TaxID=154981 RepID=UPI0021AE62C2|nr:ATP-binding cassette domain-containing protein [Aliiroseovarius crassostreae]UWP98667.1 ATP-binding cassette domain-containing protein [Aliiroseovarius crassostreae]